MKRLITFTTKNDTVLVKLRGGRASKVITSKKVYNRKKQKKKYF